MLDHKDLGGSAFILVMGCSHAIAASDFLNGGSFQFCPARLPILGQTVNRSIRGRAENEMLGVDAFTEIAFMQHIQS
jgi:hypothetical protein